MSEDRTHQLGLERAALGEAETKAADKGQVEALKKENAEFLERHPSAKVMAEVERRYRDRRRVASWMYAIPAVAMAAVLLIVVRQPPVDDVEIGRSKGHAQLLVHRAAATGPEKLGNGDAARPGDRLQLGYAPGAAGYGVIASVDGTGAITMHLPKSNDDRAAALDPKGAALPFSYELDAAPRLERFFLVVSPTPFPATEVEQAIRRLAHPEADSLNLPQGFEQTSILLRKVEP